MWVGATEHVAGETNKAGSGCATMETSGDVLGSPSLQGRETESLPQSGGLTLGALSDVMCPGWLVLCLIYVWGRGQSLPRSPSLSNLNVHSKGRSLPAARPCPLSVCGSICLFLTNLLELWSLLPPGLSGFSVSPHVCLSVCRSGLLACQKVCLPSHVWMHDLIRATDHALEI